MVQNETGPAVALAIDETVAIGPLVKEATAPRDRRLQALLPPGLIQRLRRAGVEDADPYRRVRVIEADALEAVTAVVDHCQFTGLPHAVLLADALGEDPGVALPEGRLR